MGLFDSKKEKTSILLIDVNSSSVGGALAYREHGSKLTLYFTSRVAIQKSEYEDASQAMLRTLTELTTELVTKGAPTLRKEIGSGHVDRILVSVGAPWQKTAVRIEKIQPQKPFIFTKALLNETSRKNTDLPEGYNISSESVIAILLNGYEISKPFGKKASRAELIILSSLIDATIAKGLENTLRKTYHTHALTLTAFAPAAYAVFRDIYPHEKDFLILDISGQATDVVFIKHGVLVNVTSIPQGIAELAKDSLESISPGQYNYSMTDPARNVRFESRMKESEKEWLKKIQATLQEFAVSHALPRTLFMLASKESHEYVKRLLDNPEMRSLWLTTEPLRVIPVVSSHFASFIKMGSNEAEGDIVLELLGLYSSKTESL